MACYYPLIGYRSLVADSATGKYPIIFQRTSVAGELVHLPCGQCIGCRLDHSQGWMVRIMHEAQMHERSCFVTFTYSDEKLPHDESLTPPHFQKFMKRLRKSVAPDKIRFFHCGEYGDQLGRPHYHAALFGYYPADAVFLKNTERGDRLYTSESLDKLWKKGHCWIGELTFESAAYMARYIMKKVTGDRSEDHYTKVHPATGDLQRVHSEYVTMSNRPGLGSKWFDTFSGDVFPSDFVALPNGTTVKTPAYYLRKLEDADAASHQRVKKKRAIRAKELKADNCFRRLEVKEKCKKAQVSTLKRKLK